VFASSQRELWQWLQHALLRLSCVTSLLIGDAALLPNPAIYKGLCKGSQYHAGQQLLEIARVQFMYLQTPRAGKKASPANMLGNLVGHSRLQHNFSCVQGYEPADNIGCFLVATVMAIYDCKTCFCGRHGWLCDAAVNRMEVFFQLEAELKVPKEHTKLAITRPATFV